MVVLMKSGSVLSQISNVFFLASGLFNDLLIIRLCLTLAYGFLLISALVGLPGWGDSLWQGRMAVDIIVWSIVNIVVVHGSGVIRMYYDERSIQFETEEFEMLWRFFYRHSGLSKAQFLSLVLPHLKLRTFQEGDSIPCKDHFYIVLDGMVLCEIVHEDHPSKTYTIRLASGDMFPLLYIYKNYVPRKAIFHRSAITNDPLVETKVVRAFSIPLSQLEEMAIHPHARDAWTALLIASLAEIAERQYTSAQQGIIGSRTSMRMSRKEEDYHPLFGPLTESEEPDPLLAGSGKGLTRPFGHALRYLRLSVYMPWPFGQWPVGLRHSLRPPIDPHDENNNNKKEQQPDDEAGTP